MDCLSQFKPEKLSVTYSSGVTATEPIIQRCYTLTHSDSTGNLFLTIGSRYAWENVNPNRDDVLGVWKQVGGFLYYYVYIYVDQGEYTINASAKRNEIFKRELPLALTAIRYGDRFLFDAYPYLKQASIIINFISSYPQFARQESWGTFQHFSYI
ncbi:staygreen family protein [Bacillus sp. DNRA2]|uniref:staygreen family protein n=1 Tax=Bacillus sp. DNRA2 TaxID=2723053 RepID=UPI0032B7F5E6